MRNKKEESLSIQICKYLDLQYPNVLYFCDSSGIRLTIGQAVIAKKQRCKSWKIPDLIILSPSKGYHGLVIELKKNREEVYTKDGNFRKNEHIQAQNDSLCHLIKNGYYAAFACGFDQTKNIIDCYFY